MNKLFHRKETNVPPTSSFFSGLPLFNGFFDWLAGLIRLTPEDQADAGVYLGGEGRDGRTAGEVPPPTKGSG